MILAVVDMTRVQYIFYSGELTIGLDVSKQVYFNSSFVAVTHPSPTR